MKSSGRPIARATLVVALPHIRNRIGIIDPHGPMFTDDEIILAVMRVCPEYGEHWPTDEQMTRLMSELQHGRDLTRRRTGSA